MNGDELKKRIRVWAKEVGIQAARVELLSRQLSPSTIEKLINGTYDSCPKGKTVEALEGALASTEAAS